MVQTRLILAAAAGALLLAAPIANDGGLPLIGSKTALADKGGGGHDPGPDGPGGGNGSNGNGHAYGHMAGAENGINGLNGSSSNGNAYGQLAKDDPMRPENLGRLNAFFNASSTALGSTSENSAIGQVSKTYRDLLSGYLAGDMEDEASFDEVAAAIATAANKTLTPEQVKAVNERLAYENPLDPNLAGFANPTNDPTVEAENDALAADIAERANEFQAEEPNQGLGERIVGFFEEMF